MATTSYNFNSLLPQYGNMLRPFALALTKSRENAEDLIQDTLYRALANQDKFSEGTNIKAWLNSIMRNIFINNYRRQKKSKIITDTSATGYLLNSTKKTERNESERHFLAEDISRALNAVSCDFTEPFLMYYRGFHYEEISEQLDLPLGTVKSRIFFARKELQSKLRDLDVVNSGNN